MKLYKFFLREEYAYVKKQKPRNVFK